MKKIEDKVLIENLGEENIKYNEPMKDHTTMKVGGNAKIFIEPKNEQQIINVIKYAKENNINYHVIGNGSNLVVKDEGIDGIVLKIGSRFADVDFLDQTHIKVFAGYPLVKLSYLAKENSLSGLEFASGIPGTIGGAVRMNAGAYGSEMVNVVERVGVLNTNTYESFELSNEEAKFSYRHSIFVDKPEYVVTYAIIKLEKGIKDEIEAKMNENNTSRKEKQPIEYPSSGSTFKRGDGFITAKIIDDLGLKGYKIGGAEVSTKHAGFVINSNNAKAKDVLDLIEYIKEKAHKELNIVLEEEVVILGGN